MENTFLIAQNFIAEFYSGSLANFSSNFLTRENDFFRKNITYEPTN